MVLEERSFSGQPYAAWIEHCFQHCSCSNRKETAPMNFDLQLWEMNWHLIALDCA